MTMPLTDENQTSNLKQKHFQTTMVLIRSCYLYRLCMRFSFSHCFQYRFK